MKIGACIKQVPARDAELSIASDGTWIEEPEGFESCEPDDYALEAALQLREKHGGEVVAISLGPDSVSEVLRTALAKGADRAVHITDDSSHRLDPLQIAGALAAVAREEDLDLIVTGLQSDDAGYGQTGVLLSELLGTTHATVVVDLECEGETLEVTRELEGGWSQTATLPLPAVLTIQSGINKPRYTTFKGILAAKKKEIRKVAHADVAPADIAASQTTVRIYVPEQTKHTEMLDGSAAEQAAALIGKLKNDARVL